MYYGAIVFTLLFFSCTPILKKATKVNREFSFSTQSDYYNYLVNKRGFPKEQILFLDSGSYINFGKKVLIEESPMVYFGSFLNDSISLKKSNYLKNNQACIGRMKGEIEKNLSIVFYADSIIESKINLANFNFYFLNDKKKFGNVNNKKRIKIFLLYYYPFGTLYDKLYKEIEETYLNNIEKMDLYIICVDPVYALKSQQNAK